MDWDKAKKIVIVMLLILNAGLFGLNYNKNQKYKLSQEQEKAIFQVLSQNGIGVYTDIAREFSPMRQLSVNIPILETDTLKKVFFSEDETIRITVEFDKTILKSETKSLTLEDNNIKIIFHGGSGEIGNFSQKTAFDAAEDYLMSIGSWYDKLKFDDFREMQGKYVFQYYGSYKGNKIFSNTNKIVVDETGIIEFESSYYEPEAFVGEKTEICAPDEALLTFLREVKKRGSKSGVFIEKMEIGYDFQEKREIAEGDKLKLIPCYQIYVYGEDKPYIINGYSNKIIE